MHCQWTQQDSGGIYMCVAIDSSKYLYTCLWGIDSSKPNHYQLEQCCPTSNPWTTRGPWISIKVARQSARVLRQNRSRSYKNRIWSSYVWSPLCLTVPTSNRDTRSRGNGFCASGAHVARFTCGPRAVSLSVRPSTLQKIVSGPKWKKRLDSTEFKCPSRSANGKYERTVHVRATARFNNPNANTRTDDVPQWCSMIHCLAPRVGELKKYKGNFLTCPLLYGPRYTMGTF